MTVSTPFKGLLAGLAAVAIAAIAQSTPPSTSKDPATGAGQQSTQSTPMGDSGTSKTPAAASGGSSTTPSTAAGGSSTDSSTSSSSTPSSSGSTMGASGGSTTTTTTDTTTTDTNVASKKTQGMRSDRN